MARFSEDQFGFAASKHRYMGRDESIEFLKAMNIRMSVGHWSAGDFCDRFAPPGYHSDDPAFQNNFQRARRDNQCRHAAQQVKVIGQSADANRVRHTP